MTNEKLIMEFILQTRRWVNETTLSDYDEDIYDEICYRRFEDTYCDVYKALYGDDLCHKYIYSLLFYSINVLAEKNRMKRL
jgi:hypothetical protein